jgi:hypothetical protein
LKRPPFAIEIFTQNGFSFFLEFTPIDLPEVIEHLPTGDHIVVQKSNFSDFVVEMGITDLWKNGKLTNFEYLIKLNIFGGRSFNNSEIYPIFPWVITNFESPLLNMADPTSFRDFTKPFGSPREGDSLFENGPLPPSAVALYLGRFEPFSSMPRNEQFESISQIAKLGFELIPEFFCISEPFSVGSEIVRMPKWANSPIDLIYCNRQALESDYINSQLPYWIDQIFGIHQNEFEGHKKYPDELFPMIWESLKSNEEFIKIQTTIAQSGMMPPQIFNSKHPNRNPESPDDTLPAFFTVQVTVGCLFVFDCPHALFMLTHNATIREYSFDFSVPSMDCQHEYELSDPKLITLLKGSEPIKLIRRTDNIFVVVNPSAAYFFQINWNTGYTEKITTPGPIMDVSASGGYLVASIAGGYTTILYEKDRVAASIQQYRDLTTCCAVSETFQMVAIGTRDGAIIIYDLPSAVTSGMIDMKGMIPQRLVITDSFGFIVAVVFEEREKCYSIMVYTVNRTFVKSVRIAGMITAWTKWISPKGFDYMAFIVDLQDDDSDCVKFFACDVFSLRISVWRCKTNAPVMTLQYRPEEGLFLVAQKDGRVNFIRERNSGF